MNINVRKLHPSATLPTYATDGSGCFDLYALNDGLFEDAVIPELPVTFATGLAFEIPEGHVMLVFSRSGHGFKYGTRLANCVGVIDSDYRGEVIVKLRCDDDVGSFLSVRPGDRIAQALVVPIPRVTFTEVGALSTTARGAGGFGSTGS